MRTALVLCAACVALCAACCIDDKQEEIARTCRSGWERCLAQHGAGPSSSDGDGDDGTTVIGIGCNPPYPRRNWTQVPDRVLCSCLFDYIKCAMGLCPDYYDTLLRRLNASVPVDRCQAHGPPCYYQIFTSEHLRLIDTGDYSRKPLRQCHSLAFPRLYRSTAFSVSATATPAAEEPSALVVTSIVVTLPGRTLRMTMESDFMGWNETESYRGYEINFNSVRAPNNERLTAIKWDMGPGATSWIDVEVFGVCCPGCDATMFGAGCPVDNTTVDNRRRAAPCAAVRPSASHYVACREDLQRFGPASATAQHAQASVLKMYQLSLTGDKLVKDYGGYIPPYVSSSSTAASSSSSSDAPAASLESASAVVPPADVSSSHGQQKASNSATSLCGLGAAAVALAVAMSA
eukprot:m51a1_g8677 hypothetical protein (404) ;mRNA; r:153723-154934